MSNESRSRWRGRFSALTPPNADIDRVALQRLDSAIDLSTAAADPLVSESGGESGEGWIALRSRSLYGWRAGDSGGGSATDSVRRREVALAFGGGWRLGELRRLVRQYNGARNTVSQPASSSGRQRDYPYSNFPATVCRAAQPRPHGLQETGRGEWRNEKRNRILVHIAFRSRHRSILDVTWRHIRELTRQQGISIWANRN